jgi:putative endonuclease
MKDYFVYILRCSDRSYYTGVTNNVTSRVYQHQSGIDPTCYTFTRRPFELVYTGIFGDINEAISWEKKVKRWSRAKKEALIRGDQKALKFFSKRKSVQQKNSV